MEQFRKRQRIHLYRGPVTIGWVQSPTSRAKFTVIEGLLEDALTEDQFRNLNMFSVPGENLMYPLPHDQLHVEQLDRTTPPKTPTADKQNTPPEQSEPKMPKDTPETPPTACAKPPAAVVSPPYATTTIVYRGSEPLPGKITTDSKATNAKADWKESAGKKVDPKTLKDYYKPGQKKQPPPEQKNHPPQPTPQTQHQVIFATPDQIKRNASKYTTSPKKPFKHDSVVECLQDANLARAIDDAKQEAQTRIGQPKTGDDASPPTEPEKDIYDKFLEDGPQ